MYLAAPMHLSKPLVRDPKYIIGRSRARTSLAATLLSSTSILVAAGTAEAQSYQTKDVTYSIEANTSNTVPKLNAGLAHSGYHALPGEQITFTTYWNYDRDIRQSEIRVFNRSDKYLDRPIATIPVTKEQSTTWAVSYTHLTLPTKA